MNSLKAMYGCGLNFFIKLAYNSLFYISLHIIFIKLLRAKTMNIYIKRIAVNSIAHTVYSHFQ